MTPDRRAVLETQVLLHILREPELSERCLPKRERRWHKQAPSIELALFCESVAHFISGVALGPTLCREIGFSFHFCNLSTYEVDAERDAALDLLEWLERTPSWALASLPAFDDVIAELERDDMQAAA